MSTALAVIPEAPRTLAPVQKFGLLRPVAPPTEVLTAQNEIRDMIAQTLQEGRDYGVIPGTEKKDKQGNDVSKRVLLKPGAERLGAAFGLAPSFRIVEQEVDHDRRVVTMKKEKLWNNKFKGDKSFTWGDAQEIVAFGLYRYVIECTLTQRDTGAVIASAVGSCSTLETKYADRPRDLENTVIKMASKRAIVAATLLAIGLSDQFTQDIEDELPAAEKSDKWKQPRPEASQAEEQYDEQQVEEPALTMPLALAMTVPGEANNPKVWGGKGGMALATLKPAFLKSILSWIEKGDEDRQAKFARLHTAAQMVFAFKDAEAKALEAAEAVGAADPLTPAQRAQADAIKAEAAAAKSISAPVEGFPAALKDDDSDGLSF